MQIVASGFFAGALMRTRFAPALMCRSALSRLVKKPVDSSTTSTSSAQRSSSQLRAIEWWTLSVERWTFSLMKNVIIALTVAMSSMFFAQNAVPSPMKTMLVFGDSLSEGFMLKRSQAYPMRLIEKLRAAGLEYEVTNASQTGGTSEGGLRRLPP